MKKTLTLVPLLTLLTLLMGGTAWAQMTPVGLWRTIDDKTGKDRTLVRIVETGGVVSGKIEKRLDPDAKAEDKCDKCSDDRKGQPLQGLEILRDLKKADGQDRWEGGTVIDPEEGKIYKARLTPVDGGKKLELRGYIGVPMLGRTQTWMRAE